MKTHNTTNQPGLYVIGGKHVIELQEGQQVAYPLELTAEKFASAKALKAKYPKLKVETP